MYLHQQQDKFRKAIEETSISTGFLQAQIEKDYYLFLILKTLIERTNIPVIFKGGTSLNQSYEIINRFSEDLDLSVLTEQNQLIGKGKRKVLKKDIIDTIEALNLRLINFDMIQADRDFNRYFIQYKNLFGSGIAEPNLIRLEVMLAYRPYPIKKQLTKPYLARNLIANEPVFESIKPIEITVQSLERTFIDKLFAIADFQLKGEDGRNSRHLYDIHMIFQSKKLDLGQLNSIFPEVFKDRKVYPTYNPSTTDEKKLTESLESIVMNRFFENDYNQITKNLILDDINYNTCVKSLQSILDSKIIENSLDQMIL